ncbi:hypothetical protein HGG71_05155 [Rhodobacteraceae bacterium R_SAG2]|nr:hypothetical protein [Rhodobacteraceae bacterium R_SAG2]
MTDTSKEAADNQNALVKALKDFNREWANDDVLTYSPVPSAPGYTTGMAGGYMGEAADRIATLLSENDALRTQLQAARDAKARLPWREKDIQRGLILFRTSNNAHGYTNYSALSGKIYALPQAARDELAAIMVNMALGYSRDDVNANGVVQQWIEEARDEALEEAAKAADDHYLVDGNDVISEAIRALKSTSAEGVRDAGAGHSIPRHSIPKHFSDVGGTELFARAISRALKRGKFYGSPIIPVEPEDIPNDRSD